MSAEFKDRFKLLRTEFDYNQNDIAQRLSINRTNISHYEQGRSIPDAETLSKIADIFNVSVDYLLGRTNDRTPSSDDAPYIPNTIAAHFEGEEFSEEALSDIANFIDLIAMREREKRGE